MKFRIFSLYCFVYQGFVMTQLSNLIIFSGRNNDAEMDSRILFDHTTAFYLHK